MPTKAHRNSFQQGMDKETDPAQVAPNQYLDGYNVSISQDGRDKQLSTFHGTDILSTLVASGDIVSNDTIHLMGVYETVYLIDDVETNCALAFVYNEKNPQTFYAIVIPETGSTNYITYTEEGTLSDTDRFVDCVIYKEGGVNYAYFADYERAIKKLPCVIDVGTKGDTANPYSREEILMLRTGFRGSMVAVPNTSGSVKADLANGTYQFAWRLHSQTENKYTRWSSLSQPTTIGVGYDNPDEQSYGGTGYTSTIYIDCDLSLWEDYETNSIYTHYQLAVFENINGDGAPILTAKLLQPESLSAFTGVSAPYTATYVYAANKQAVELVTVDELTIDDAAIQAVKTLAIKNNRLIAGNIKYQPLDFDNGEPAITSGTGVVKETLTKAVGYRDYDAATNKVGYFRDELYRFGVVYYDEFGNYSKVKVLDFSGTNSYASQGDDFRFPSRQNGRYGPLINTSGNIEALGLAIKNLTGHPSWAKGFHIVRVPRKKRIQFQTPVVPSILVMPAKAVGDYPDQRRDLDSENDETPLDVLNVEAANPDGTYVPKNFFHVITKNLLRFGDFYGPVGEVTGGLYGTHNITAGPSQYWPAAVNPSLSPLTGYMIYLSDDESGPKYNADYVDADVKVRWVDATESGDDPPSGYRDIIASDAVTVEVHTRTKRTDPGGWSTGINITTTYETATGFVPALPFNFTTTDYNVEIRQNA